MASKFPGQKFFSGIDAKSRIFLLFAGVVGIVLLVYLGVRFLSEDSAVTGAATIKGVPSDLVSVPGGSETAKFGQAIEKANLQRAEQAKINASQAASAIPTLSNLSSGAGDCTYLCPGPDNANVADDINGLVNAGALGQEDANNLLDLASQNVSPDEFAALLDALVKAGKLTPEQARKLLEKYRQQHANALVNESAKMMDGMIKAGQLPLSTANELLELQKKRLTPAEYAAELERLVREGKLSPEAAAALLAQYTKQYQTEAARSGAAALKRMVSNGELTPDSAKILQDLQDQNVPLNTYADQLNKLVGAGKITPATAAKLLDQYRSQRIAGATTGILGDLLAKGGPSADFAKRLLDLQANNASIQDYGEELKKGVVNGLISSNEAEQLYRQYQGVISQPPAAGVSATIQASVPGFAALQRNVQTRPAEAQQFDVPQAPGPNQAEIEAARQQRLQRIIAAMSDQAQKLSAQAWYVPKMVHKEGSPPKKDDATGDGGSGGSGSGSGSKEGTANVKIPLIKAGTILFAVLDTAVDSDYPDTPVMATIIEGKFKNAKLLGKLSLAEGKDKVSLNFTLMDEEDWISARTINAFAIDPDTARTVMASEVDRHYLERYGAIMATSFLQGYSSAITNAGTSTTGIFGTSTDHPELNQSSKIFVGLGQIGTNLQAEAAKKINMPTTVKVNAGVGLGILFTAEVAE